MFDQERFTGWPGNVTKTHEFIIINLREIKGFYA